MTAIGTDVSIERRFQIAVLGLGHASTVHARLSSATTRDAMEPSDPLTQTIGKVLGRIPSGIFVLTVKHDGRATAMLASWVQQAAFAPPAISVALAKVDPSPR